MTRIIPNMAITIMNMNYKTGLSCLVQVGAEVEEFPGAQRTLSQDRHILCVYYFPFQAGFVCRYPVSRNDVVSYNKSIRK